MLMRALIGILLTAFVGSASAQYGASWTRGPLGGVDIGTSIPSGTATRILYIDASGNLANSAKFTVSDTAGTGMTIAAGVAAANTGRILSLSGAWTDGISSNIAAVLNVTQGTGTGKLLSLQSGAGGISEQFNVTQGGVTTSETAYIIGNAAGFFQFGTSARAYLGAPAAGVIKLGDGTDADFGRLVFGGTTSSFPALKRTTTALNVRLADDSADGGLTAGTLALSSTLGVRALSTLTDGADGTNTSGYKFVSFQSNSVEAGNVIRVAQTAAVVFTTSSDERLKIVHGDSDRTAATNRILAHRMKDYEWKASPGTMYAGPLAQQAYATDASPMLVQRGGDDPSKNPWSINMAGYIPDLIMTVQELAARVQQLEAR